MKKLAKICALLALTVLLLSLGTTAFAEGSVSYDADANEFIFAPGGSVSPTNLFGGFQNVMPGDKLTDSILVRNTTADGVKIRVYLRSLGAQNDTEELLSQLFLTVRKADDSLLFEAPANETAQLSDWVYLGTVYPGGQTVLKLSLDVPVSLGNEFKNMAGCIDWEFKIEEIPIVNSDVKTGDSHGLFLYGAAMLLCLAGAWVLAKEHKKRIYP